MEREKLTAILDAHTKWLRDDGGERANLSWADLSGANLYRANLSWADLSGANLYRADLYRANLSWADLSGANLSGADLSGANLPGANLSRANLSGADLSRANLPGANLSGADLSGANLSGANLSWADLSRANLSGANLSGADLFGANLSGANLYRANLSGANLSGANLSGANLYRANLSGANLSGTDGIDAWRYQICPEYGSFSAFKKVCGAILRLDIPDGAKRVNAPGGRKIRVDKAVVVAVVEGEGKEWKSLYDDKFIYRLGQEVTTAFDDSPLRECSQGIHCFLTVGEAREFNL